MIFASCVFQRNVSVLERDHCPPVSRAEQQSLTVALEPDVGGTPEVQTVISGDGTAMVIPLGCADVAVGCLGRDWQL